jgi:hypothetical protein
LLRRHSKASFSGVTELTKKRGEKRRGEKRRRGEEKRGREEEERKRGEEEYQARPTCSHHCNISTPSHFFRCVTARTSGMPTRPTAVVSPRPKITVNILNHHVTSKRSEKWLCVHGAHEK